jgi:hypothetical protein
MFRGIVRSAEAVGLRCDAGDGDDQSEEQQEDAGSRRPLDPQGQHHDGRDEREIEQDDCRRTPARNELAIREEQQRQRVRGTGQ